MNIFKGIIALYQIKIILTNITIKHRHIYTPVPAHIRTKDYEKKIDIALSIVGHETTHLIRSMTETN
jgi:hypothetical protein